VTSTTERAADTAVLSSAILVRAIVSYIRPVMIVSGLLTATMFTAAFAPAQAMVSNFGEPLSGPASAIVVRSWGTLIGLVGLMLLYGAFVPATRTLVLIVAAASKAIFVGLVLSHGSRYLGYQIGVAVVADSVMVLLFGWYLAAAGTAGTLNRDSHG
jgi:hypothetical protein